ncbi:hypothetical protein BDZ85DRAFT_13058 [Elsinoe ampelina]|uniref:NACHT domain-containing protein n=1 Tax=Elsinoe ampelina TaxID=302913 RepID=A0A6A6GR18_9PEZI|nr:hypothetical protein BDZ85DRAFT_13058 [Elsinoe ampelina]
MADQEQLGSAHFYTIGWIAALPMERAAALAMLDQTHRQPKGFMKHHSDSNQYAWGSIGGHNIAIASLPSGRYGTVSAAGTAHCMQASLPSVKLGLLVGIGAGIPRLEKGHDIRLGDVVVSMPTNQSSGVIQYDLGKAQKNGVFKIVGHLNSPPEALLKAVAALEAEYFLRKPRISRYLEEMLQAYPHMSMGSSSTPAGFVYQGHNHDRLFTPDALHVEPTGEPISSTDDTRSCSACSPAAEIFRQARKTSDPSVHYGIIASGDTVVKDGLSRQAILDRLGDDCMCFEMEAAGLMNTFPCLVVRGICDYADTHKNDRWQPYAAATAAAYVKELLSMVDAQDVDPTPTIANVMHRVERIQESVITLQHSILESKRPLLLPGLPDVRAAAFDYEDDEKNVVCLEETRVDLLQNIYNWANNDEDKPIFWLNGIAGTGKSTIARTVALRWSKQERLGASFFFKRGERLRSSAPLLLSTVASQLAQRFDEIRESLREILATNPQATTRGLTEQFQLFLLEPLKASGITTLESQILVIDALDECADENDTSTLIKLLAATSHQTRLRCFVTCRPEATILERFASIDSKTYHNIVLHQVTESSIESDLETYLWHEFDFQKSKVRNKSRADLCDPTWPAAGDLKNLARLARPLFIFAATVCRYIWGQGADPRERLDEILNSPRFDSLPQMERTYLPVVDRIVRNGNAELAMKGWIRDLLGTILILFQPLSRSSLCDFGLRDQCSLLPDLHSVLDIPTSENAPIRPLHLSFQEFIIAQSGHINDKDWYRVPEKEAHLEMSKRCLQYLMVPGRLSRNPLRLARLDTTRQDVSRDLLKNVIGVELSYACRYWVDHLLQSRDTTLYQTSVLGFLEKHLLHWIEVLLWLDECEKCLTQIKTIAASALPLGNDNLNGLLYDASRLIGVHYHAIASSPLQLYASALLYSPTTSIIRHSQQPEMPPSISLQPSTSSHPRGPRQQHLVGHIDTIISVLYSRSGECIASASLDRTVRLWNATNGLLIRSFRCDQARLSRNQSTNRGSRTASDLAMDFSSDGQLFAASPIDAMIQIVRVEDGITTVSLHDANQHVVKVYFSRMGNNEILAATASGCVLFWDGDNAQLLHCLDTGQGSLQTVILSPDGRLLSTMCPRGSLRIWDTCTKAEIYPEVASIDIIEMTGGKVHARLTSVGPLQYESRRLVIFSPSCHVVALSRHGTQVEVWKLFARGSKLRRGPSITGIQDLSFSADGEMLAVRSVDKIVVLDSEHAQTLHTLTLSLANCAFMPNPTLLLLLTHDNTLHLWSLKPSAIPEITSRTRWNAETIRRQHDLPLEISPGGFWCCTTSTETYDIVKQPIGQDREPMHGILAIIFAPDGASLYTTARDSGSVNEWDTATGKLVQQLHPHGECSLDLDHLAMSPDGTWLAASSSRPDRPTGSLWNLQTSEFVKTFHPRARKVVFGFGSFHAHAAFSSDSASLVYANDTAGLVQYDLHSRSKHSRWHSFLKNCSLVACAPNNSKTASVCTRLMFGTPEYIEIFASPGGRKLFSSVTERKLCRLTWPQWKVTDELWLSNVWTRSAPMYLITKMVFSADSTLLAALWEDKKISVWNTDTGTYLSTLTCSKQPHILDFSPTAPCVLQTEYDSWHMDCLCTVQDHDWKLDRLERFFIEDNWLVYRGERQLWIPPEYRGLVARSKTGKMAIGQANGKVSIYG